MPCPLCTIMMSRIFFESLWLPAVVWFAVQFVLVAVWSWRRTSTPARVVWGGFAALPLLIGLSIWVVTPRERIIQLCKGLAGFVDDGNITAIGLRLTDDFVFEDYDRQAFLSRVERSLTEYRVDDPRLSSFRFEFSDSDHGTVEFHASARVRSQDLVHDWVPSRWRLTVRQVGDEWRVSRIEALRVGPTGIGNVLEWVR